MKQVDAHYETPEHRAWAKAVVARAGGRCQWEGCTRAAPAHRMIADHIVEIKDGGAKLDLANGQCLCVQHNTLKGTQARAARMARRSKA
ncbi:HNH endonuclease signature motif containing protein [Ancylobacter defluvii]|uniref:HNH endonuclease signature motif containing protein n=1 Tax=Ancylobacter defluvii TaxID=1282440 RepID=UPI0022F27514|nr:HNH endonuclease signature motif containing protein [Ancylobacter defluvii]